MTATIPASLIAQPATAQITLTNPDGLTSNAVPFAVSGPVPVLTSLRPATVPAGNPAFSLAITGSNFYAGITVSFNATKLNTAFISSTELTAAVPADLIAKAGNASITAANIGSASSNALPFTIVAPPLTITSITPSTVNAGGPTFTMTVNGGNFAAATTVSMDGTALPATYVSPSQLSATVAASRIVLPGTRQITAQNPDGASSNAVILTVTAPPAVLTSLSPSRVPVNGPEFILTVTGTGIVDGATVVLGNTSLSTTFVSSTQLSAAVPASLTQQTGPLAVTASNPGGGVSNSLTLTVIPPTPTVSGISPTTVTFGGPDFILTVMGDGFLPGALVRFNNIALSTSVDGRTVLSARVPADLIATPGSVKITVENPGGDPSVVAVLEVVGQAVLTSISPGSATAGGPALTLTLNGTGFVQQSSVQFNTTTLITHYVSDTQLTADLPASALTTPGTAQVTVLQGGTASNQLAFTVNLPAPPSLRLSAPATAGAAQQPPIDFGLNTGYPLQLSATVVLTFAPNASLANDDAAVQFAGGGRTMNFTVPPNTTALPALMLQTGTIAGTITLRVTLTSGGVDVTPPGSTATITIAKSAPVIRRVTLVRNQSSFEVDITGFSSTLEVSSATFQFAVTSGSTPISDVTVPVGPIFSGWFQSTAAASFGSQFTYAQPFTVTGDASRITSITVTLTNTVGTSPAVTSN